MKYRLNNLLILIACSFLMFSCVMQQPASQVNVAPKVINLDLVAKFQENLFVNLDYGIKVNVNDKRSNFKILHKHDNYVTSLPNVNVYPDVKSFTNESIRRYMRTMGFKLDSDISSDYFMNIDIKLFNVSFLNGIGWSAVVNLDISVFDHNNRQVYPTTSVTGRASRAGNGNDYSIASNTVNNAYANALEDIDWNRIAYLLKRSNSPANEKDKKVVGDGSTALEHLVLSWEVTSRPLGADVYWRVISSTPEVKNSNKNYKGTTPYEATESFDIKGLSYNNSGDVQIEITCEKPGYLTQRKVFNLRAAIDQKSINAHFTLVKEE